MTINDTISRAAEFGTQQLRRAIDASIPYYRQVVPFALRQKIPVGLKMPTKKFLFDNSEAGRRANTARTGTHASAPLSIKPVNCTKVFHGDTVAIVTACDENMALLLMGLVESLGTWNEALTVIDIGLSDETRKQLNQRNVTIFNLPDDLFQDAAFAEPYMRAMYLRPNLPKFVNANFILWIDSDCWVQNLSAIELYLESAMRHRSAFSICTMMDVDYQRCIQDYLGYHDMYLTTHEQLFGKDEAKFLYGKAIFSSGVFAAHRDSPVWLLWWEEVRRLYETNDQVRYTKELGHMAEQQALNRILHRTGHFICFTSEYNWNCHCSDTARENSLVLIFPSKRVPAIIHLSLYKQMQDDYRKKRLLYEPRPDSNESEYSST